MKRMKKLFYAAVCSVSIAAMVTGCGDQAASDEKQTAAQAEGEEITVTFMNGDIVLGTVDGMSGEVLSQEAYKAYEQAEDAEFKGWYETPGFLESSLKDLSTDVFDESTTLYGNFMSTNIAEDTRKWYIAGTSAKGILKENSWAGGIDDALKESFELKPTGNAVNEFALTIDLFEGDQFQIIHDWAWDGQKGFGLFTEIDETQLKSGGGLGGTADTANVEVVMDGNYTFTLTTNPDNAAQDTLTAVRNGDPLTEGEETAEEPFVPSADTSVSVKGSWVEDWSELKPLTREDGTNKYTIRMELSADTELCFSVFEKEEDTGIVLKEENVTDDASKALLTETGGNLKVPADGTYEFTVDLDSMTVTVTQ